MILREAVVTYRETGISLVPEMIEDSYTAAETLRKFFKTKELDYEKEHFFVMMLNGRNKIKEITVEIVSIGTQTSCLVSSSQVFKNAIRSGANSIIVAHNHPSGDVVPSRADLATTTKLKECSKILDINFLDHIIFGMDSRKIYSFSEQGLI
jgi:DNA repair protein RadC